MSTVDNITNRVYHREDVNFVYIPIPRCGSTWLRHVFEYNKFNTSNTIRGIKNLSINLNETTKLIVLRDPLEKLISGMCSIENFDLDTIYSRKKIFNNCSVDIHTLLEIDFIKDMNIDNAIFVKYESIQAWGPYMYFLLKDIIPNFKEGSQPWFTPYPLHHQHLLDVVRNNKEIYNNLMEYLKEDQLFFNQVRWHGTN